MVTSVTTLSLLDVIVDIVYILFFLLMTLLLANRYCGKSERAVLLVGPLQHKTT